MESATASRTVAACPARHADRTGTGIARAARRKGADARCFKGPAEAVTGKATAQNARQAVRNFRSAG